MAQPTIQQFVLTNNTYGILALTKTINLRTNKFDLQTLFNISENNTLVSFWNLKILKWIVKHVSCQETCMQLWKHNWPCSFLDAAPGSLPCFWCVPGQQSWGLIESLRLGLKSNSSCSWRPETCLKSYETWLGMSSQTWYLTLDLSLKTCRQLLPNIGDILTTEQQNNILTTELIPKFTIICYRQFRYSKSNLCWKWTLPDIYV